MTSDEYNDILYNHRNLRLFARILGSFELALMFYIAFTEFREELNSSSPSPLLSWFNGQYFLVITLTLVFAGLIIAYWKEGLGGGIALLSFIVFFIGWSDFHVNFILGMMLFALPSVLYVVYRLLIYRDVKKAKQGSKIT